LQFSKAVYPEVTGSTPVRSFFFATLCRFHFYTLNIPRRRPGLAWWGGGVEQPIYLGAGFLPTAPLTHQITPTLPVTGASAVRLHQ
jgi:hypothetical protein